MAAVAFNRFRPEEWFASLLDVVLIDIDTAGDEGSTVAEWLDANAHSPEAQAAILDAALSGEAERDLGACGVIRLRRAS